MGKKAATETAPAKSQSPVRKRSRSRSRSATTSTKASTKAAGKTTKKTSPARTRNRGASKSKEDSATPPVVRRRSRSQSRLSAPAIVSKPVFEDLAANNNAPSTAERKFETIIKKTVVTHNVESSTVENVTKSDHSATQQTRGKKQCSSICQWLGYSQPWGGPVAAHILLVILLLAPFIIFQMTQKSSVPLMKTPVVEYLQRLLPRNVTADVHSLTTFGSFILLQFVWQFLPVTGLISVSTGRRLHYRCSAFPRFLLTGITMGAVYYFRPQICVNLAKQLDKFVYYTALFAILCAGLAHVLSWLAVLKPRDCVANTLSGCPPYNFLVGRMLHPRLPALVSGSVDLKLWMYETSDICGFVVACLWLTLKPADSQLQMIVAFITIYLADILINERDWLSSLEMKEEGLGLLQSLLNLHLLPWLLTVPAGIVATSTTTVQWPLLPHKMLLVGGFLLCAFFQRKWRSLKFQNVRDSQLPALKGRKVIVGHNGHKILAFGPWSVIRHPDVLMELLMLVGWTLPAGCAHALPWLAAAVYGGYVLYRVHLEEKANHVWYGPAWNSYTATVRSRLIPYIY